MSKEKRAVKKVKRKIQLENLPRKSKGKGVNVDWRACVKSKLAVSFSYDDVEGVVWIVDYERNKKQHLTIKYNNEEYELTTSNFMKCQFGRMLNKKSSKFKTEIGTRFKDDKRDITIIDRKYIKDGYGWNKKYYKYLCNKCGFDCGEHYKDGEYREESWISESALKQQGCSCCCSNSLSVVKGINDIATTHSNLVKYFVNIENCYKYSYGSGKKTINEMSRLWSN